LLETSYSGVEQSVGDGPIPGGDGNPDMETDALEVALDQPGHAP
jgi:hypothetical protein